MYFIEQTKVEVNDLLLTFRGTAKKLILIWNKTFGRLAKRYLILEWNNCCVCLFSLFALFLCVQSDFSKILKRFEQLQKCFYLLFIHYLFPVVKIWAKSKWENWYQILYRQTELILRRCLISKLYFNFCSGPSYIVWT